MKRLCIILTIALAVFSARAQQPAVAPPTMGWSSWNTFSVNISEDIIKGQADAMVDNGFSAVGYNYINIDDGFQYGRTADGKVRIHPQRFPNGLRVVSDYIHSKGLKAGIYSDAGDCTCGSISNGDTQNTNVGFYGHEQTDADFYFIENDFDFIKVDYCGGSHANLNEKDQYTAIANAIKNTGRDVRYNLCRWAYPGTWCHDISTSWRTTGDIYDGWESVKGILAENLYLSAYCYDGCYNDMDMLEVGRSMTEEEDKTHFGMWCIMASPLLIGCNMATINDRAKALLQNKELIALNQDALGLQAYVAQRSGDTYILVKDIENLEGNTRAVALYNPSDKDVAMTLCFSDVDLGGKVAVRDLFAHEDLGQKEGAMTILVPAHATRIYRLEAEQRLERYLYEAETAYMTSYQEIYNNESAETAIYIGDGNAQGGEYAGWLGKKADNDLIWRNVWSAEGGDYTATFHCGSQEDRSFTCQVNGDDAATVTVNSSVWNTFKDYTVSIHLNAGTNSVRLYNASAWMPNIDYMTIEKAGTSDIADRSLSSACARLQANAEFYPLTAALQDSIASLLLRANEPTAKEDATLSDDIEAMLSTIEKVVPLCDEFADWWAYAEKNINISEESDALTTLQSKMQSAKDSFDEAATYTAVNKAVSTLKSGVKSYLKSESSLPCEGEEFDMTYLLTNFDFSSQTGWQGNPTYRSGCGEEFDKAFDMYQTLAAMRPGVYTIRCNALYRTTNNDAGAAYKAGTEVIPAVFYVNDQNVALPSLYSYDWPEASKYSSVDNLNGYAHSMYAAGLCFAEGAYENELTVNLDKKGSLRIGLKCDDYKEDCWCCFDNFSIHFRPFNEAENISTAMMNTTQTGDCYDISGRRMYSTAKNTVIIKKGKKFLQ